MRAPVLMPVTNLNGGRVPAAVQPHSRPAPKAPLAPPPEMASTFAAPVASTTPRGSMARAWWIDSTRLRCNTGLYSSPQARTLGIPGTVACRTSSLGTVLWATVAHPAVSTYGTRARHHSHPLRQDTRAVAHRRLWLATIDRRLGCSTSFLMIIEMPSHSRSLRRP